MYGCMSTETTSMSLQIINISRFFHSLTEDTILVQPQKKNLKGEVYRKKLGGGGIPSHSDRKSHFILKINHQIF